MKKSTSAAIAGGLGFVLLVGGAGSLAYWNDSKDVAPQTISSGQLELGAPVEGAWTVTHGASDTTPEDYTGPVVPGDILTKTIDVPVTLSGQNLVADFVAEQLAVSNAGPQNQDLVKALKMTVVSVDGKSGGTTTIKSSDNKTTVPVVISVELPGSATNSIQAEALEFTAKYTLTQRAAN